MLDSAFSDHSERTGVSESGVSASSSGFGAVTGSGGDGELVGSVRRNCSSGGRGFGGAGFGSGFAGRTSSSHCGPSVASRSYHGRGVNMSFGSVMASQIDRSLRRYSRCPSRSADCASDEAMIDPAEAPTKIVGVN